MHLQNTVMNNILADAYVVDRWQDDGVLDTLAPFSSFMMNDWSGEPILADEPVCDPSFHTFCSD